MSNPFFTKQDIPIMLAMFVWWLIKLPFVWLWQGAKRLWVKLFGGDPH